MACVSNLSPENGVPAKTEQGKAAEHNGPRTKEGRIRPRKSGGGGRGARESLRRPSRAGGTPRCGAEEGLGSCALRRGLVPPNVKFTQRQPAHEMRASGAEMAT
ncbi:Hypothetical predicted protein [Podarcis lilfordi]|uniref:Uncharacterized protein n=1 Tax=Podarcis lilfordi TaxID=74358 RepID=A0AA35PBY7_9SAUR|nr:Hypothetical predicted protein [Podarcis lilfordi]